MPFLSKVTGVPMVELAVRIALGETLEELGWPNGLLEPPPFVAVKAPAFSTTKLRGVDPSVGPGMQSTGEVIGIHADPRVAMAKALIGASLVPPRVAATPARARGARRAALDRRPRQAPAAATSPPRSAAPATGSRRRPGPGRASARPGFGVTPVAKLGRRAGRRDRRGRDHRGDRAATSGSSSTPRRRAPAPSATPAEIRHAATAEGILCLTAIETAVAAAEALDPVIADRLADVHPLDEWVTPGARRAPSRLKRGRSRRCGRVTDGFDLVVFDCDGVLVDSERLSIRLDAELLRQLGWELTDEEIVERWVGRTEAAMKAEIADHLGRDIDDGVVGLRRALRPGLRRGAGAGRRHRRGGRRDPGRGSCDVRRVERRPRQDPAQPRQDGPARPLRGRLFSADDVEHGKPAPDLFLHAAEVMGVAPERTAVIEDSAHGVAAGSRRG